MRSAMRFRLYGVIFLVLLVVAVWLTAAVFGQKFTKFDRVALNTDHIGLQLPERADVKVRGEIIGQVMSTRTRKGGAQMTLGIFPDKIGSIPDNVSASLIPKTLFGEKYVSLDIPKNASSTALKKGDTIKQTKLPVEVEQVLSDIYPLLRTVQPAEINYTLNSLADALEGRGDKLGNSLEILDGYLKKMNPEVPALVRDIRLLSTTADTYADVVPQLAATLRNTTKTGNTLLGRETRLRTFLRDTSAFSATTKSFLDQNGDNIIALGNVSRPTADLLAAYSPEFPCLLKGIVSQADLLATTFRGQVFHINAGLIEKSPRTYNAGDKPVFGAKNPPHCGTLPNPPYSPSNPYKAIPDFNDGVAGQLSVPRTAPGFDGKGSVAPTVLGTADEKGVVNALLAPDLHTSADDVPDVATLLFAPVARGSVVSN